MKPFKFLATCIVAGCMPFFISSCNSGTEKKAEEATSAVDTAMPVVEPAVQAAVATPVKPPNVEVIKHKVANYAKWKAAYDAHDSVRLAYGLHNYVVSRGLDDSNMVMVALHMDDVAKAKAFAGLPDLKETMKKGGVLGVPSISYIDVQMLDTSVNAQTRVRVTHKVKDWDAWKKSFDSHKQARMDAGLIDRSVGYEIGDNHLVSIVFAVSDMKKAKDFMNSKDLKDKMAEAGVVDPPSFFYYNVVQKY